MDSHQTPLFTAVLTIGVLMGVIIVYFIVSLVRHQKRNLELSRLNVLSEITTLEKEHARLARDLHDELGPILTSVNFTLKSIGVVKEDEALVERASHQLNEAIYKIREIAAGLMPSSLEQKGLKVALEDFIGLLTAPLKIHLQYFAATTIPEEKSTHIYRLFKEIIQNALKHSEATDLFLQLKADDNKIHIICEDNGKGFDYTKAMLLGKGIGLRNLKSRTELMDGKFNLYSVPGKGTQYRITIPLKEKKNHD